MAVPVLNEEVTVTGPPEVYELEANLEQGGAPLGRSWQFNVSDAVSLPELKQVVTVWGFEERR